jgi:subtilisin-like proprotein convertase family protein
VENVGADDGTGIAGVLNSGSALCTVTDAAADFPDAVAGAVVQTLPDHFAVTIDPGTPNGHVAPLSLDWAAAGGYSGSTLFSLPVCEPLVISDASVDFVGNATAVLSWTTNVPASSQVLYGDTVPPALVVDDIGLRTNHIIELTGLDACTDYFVEIVSTSPDCYTTIDDNGGGYHGFTTTAGTVIAVDSTDTPLAIPDNTPAGVSSTVAVSSQYDVVDVNVLVNITHTYTGDLDLFLIGPNGTSVELSSDNGSSGNNFTDTLFDDDAETSITDGSAPFTGSFRPEQPLADLNGQPGSGDWIFKVIDDAGIDTGAIESWQLQLTVNEPCDEVGLVFRDGFEGGDTTAWSQSAP